MVTGTLATFGTSAHGALPAPRAAWRCGACMSTVPTSRADGSSSTGGLSRSRMLQPETAQDCARTGRQPRAMDETSEEPRASRRGGSRPGKTRRLASLADLSSGKLGCAGAMPVATWGGRRAERAGECTKPDRVKLRASMAAVKPRWRAAGSPGAIDRPRALRPRSARVGSLGRRIPELSTRHCDSPAVDLDSMIPRLASPRHNSDHAHHAVIGCDRTTALGTISELHDLADARGGDHFPPAFRFSAA
jgi:hypothetical protein